MYDVQIKQTLYIIIYIILCFVILYTVDDIIVFRHQQFANLLPCSYMQLSLAFLSTYNDLPRVDAMLRVE